MTTRQSPRTLPRVVWDDEWQAPPTPKPVLSVRKVTAVVCLLASGVALLAIGALQPDRQPARNPTTTQSSGRPPIIKPSAALLPPPVASRDQRWEPDELEVTEWSQPSRQQAPHSAATVSPQPRAPTTQRQPGYLSVNSTPWAQLSLDGRVVGNTPQIRLTVTPGRHHVVLARDGFQTHSAWVTVTPGGTVRLTDIALTAIER